jgi:hypothetical protein
MFEPAREPMLAFCGRDHPFVVADALLFGRGSMFALG